MIVRPTASRVKVITQIREVCVIRRVYLAQEKDDDDDYESIHELLMTTMRFIFTNNIVTS